MKTDIFIKETHHNYKTINVRIIMKKLIFFFLIMVNVMTNSVSKDAILKVITESKNPFTYDLGLKVIPSKDDNAQIMICCHGYGDSNQIADVIHSYGVVSDHLVSFNFPDFGVPEESGYSRPSFGTINEVLPLLYVLKICVIDLQQRAINLYGFSAGGGAVINALSILNQYQYDEQLKKVGISIDEKKVMIRALEAGKVILDCPLKSMEEIMAFRGSTPEFELLAQQYAQNNMRPIDAINSIKGLKLHIILHFQQYDEMLSNRDDVLCIERLQKANQGKTDVVIGFDGGHNTFHASLWNTYKS